MVSNESTQSCPVCGRRIQINAELLGTSVACPHCNGEFTVNGGDAFHDVASPADVAFPSEGDDLMARVESALERVSQLQEMTAVRP